MFVRWVKQGVRLTVESAPASGIAGLVVSEGRVRLWQASQLHFVIQGGTSFQFKEGNVIPV